MKNQYKQAVPKLNTAVMPTDNDMPSLKSRRGSRMEEYKNDKSGVPMFDEGKEQAPVDPSVSAWKCPECKFLNKFGESEDCSSCKFNLNYCEDIAACLVEMKQSEFDKQVKEHKIKPKDEPIKDNDWMCEFCTTKNTMTESLDSAVCSNPQCKQKNEVIEYMITAQTDQKQTKNEQAYYDYYKNKG
jgi:hypothetical protein